MALTQEVRQEVQSVWNHPSKNMVTALRTLADAILDLDRAIGNLEATVERAERAAIRREERPA